MTLKNPTEQEACPTPSLGQKAMLCSELTKNLTLRQTSPPATLHMPAFALVGKIHALAHILHKYKT